MRCVVTEVQLLDVAQAAYKEAGPDQQDERERALNDEQRRARPRPMVRALARTGLERGRYVGTPGKQRRRYPGEEPDTNRRQRREDEHS